MPLLESLRTVGSSGLTVSPLTLGTMTVGNPAWGSADETSESILNAFLEAGGNSIDTADVYSGGKSEELLGRVLAERGLRDDVVLASKWSFRGGNSRRNALRCLEGSLRRLRTDFLDLFWMHVWDGITPADEILDTLVGLVRSGKIRYFGLSDCPAWLATEIATLARAHATPAPVALQLEYSLVAREIEREHLPAARACKLGLLPWSPLAGGFLSGKYTSPEDAAGKGRLGGANPFQGPFTKFTERNWAILSALREVAAQAGRSPAEVALAWTLRRPGVTSVIVGANSVAQLRTNLGALSLQLSPEGTAALDRASAPDLGMHALFNPEMTARIVGRPVQTA